MKFTLTGSLGNIGKPQAEILIKAGHELTIISDEPDMKAKIEALGAKAAIGSVAGLHDV
jgi:NAD(P)H dehydrogenase (quinone)